MTLSLRFKEAFKTALAMVIAYGIALSMDWEKPYWAAFAIAFISLATVGQSINKGALRMLGTLLGVIVSLTLVALYPQDRWELMAVLSTFVGLCTYQMGGGRRQYLWNVAGFVSVIICMGSIPATGNAFDLAVLRAQETGLGILIYTLVTLLLWPVSTARQFNECVRRLVSTQHQLYLSYLRLLDGAAETEDVQALRLQEAREFSQLSELLIGAQADSYEVWELRRQWARFETNSRQVMETLERWRESFREAHDLDLRVLLTAFPDLAGELDGRFGQIERMLADQAPDDLPESRVLSLNRAALRSLSQFQKAALAVTRSQLERLESLTRSLFETIADIKGFVPPDQQPTRTAVQRQPGGVPDMERLVAAVRVMAGVWLAYLVWLYVEVPGGIGFVIMTTSMGMAVATQPQLPVSIAFRPAVAAIAFAGSLYIFVMPRLSGFAELAALIFSVTFVICYLFYTPRQVIGRSIGLAIFLVMAGISNEQTYDFLGIANTALMFTLVLALLAFIADFPVSTQPEKAFLRLLRRFFRSCEYLAATLRRDPSQTPSRLERWRTAFHAGEVATLPQKLPGWSRSIDSRMLHGSTAEALQDLVTVIQALGYRMQEMLEARAAPRSAVQSREIHCEIDTWRAGLQEVFHGLSDGPDTANHEDLRSLLGTKLEGLEKRLEETLDTLDTSQITPQEAVNSYLLLGAHRAVSEAIIAFAKQAGDINWARLREARF